MSEIGGQNQQPESSGWSTLENTWEKINGYARNPSSVVQDTADWATSANPVSDTSPNSSLQSAYDFNYRVFPNDLGMDYYGHYMIININIPTKGYSFGDGQLRDPAGIVGPAFSTPLQDASTVDTLRFGKGNTITDPRTGQQAPQSNFGSGLVGARQTRRIAESIALFMPAGLNFNTVNEYENASLAERFGTVGIGAAYGGLQQLQQLGKAPINPGVEVFFINTLLRQFSFTFLFAPKNEQESLNLEAIIKTIRFHAAPEINNAGLAATGIGVGTTWIPPAEFDFMFMHRGTENRNIPRINTSVLREIRIDYNPQSALYSTFSNGHPVHVQMDLTFQEVEPVHKLRVLQGFY